MFITGVFDKQDYKMNYIFRYFKIFQTNLYMSAVVQP